MKSQKENKCHERMGMCMGQEKGLNALFLSHLGIDMASEKWGKTLIFAKIPEGKKACTMERKRGEDG